MHYWVDQIISFSQSSKIYISAKIKSVVLSVLKFVD